MVSYYNIQHLTYLSKKFILIVQSKQGERKIWNNIVKQKEAVNIYSLKSNYNKTHYQPEASLSSYHRHPHKIQTLQVKYINIIRKY